MYDDEIEFGALSINDLDWFINLRNSVRFFLHNSNWFTLEDTKRWFEAGCNGNQYFIVFFRGNRAGYVRLNNTESSETYLGLDLDEKFRGIGLSKYIYAQFVRKYYPSLITDTIRLRVLRSNQRACNLYIKLGFKVIEVSDTDFCMEIKAYDILNIK